MPTLDFASLSLLTFVSLSAMSCALPFAMGRDAISPAARFAQRYFLLHAGSWGCIVVASQHRGSPLDIVFACLATVCVACAQWCMACALQHWLGPRRGRRWLALCCCIGPLGFALLWNSLPLRMGWFSAMQACGLLLLASMCLRPSSPAERGWRMVLCGCASVIASLLLLRSVLALLQHPALPDFAAQTRFNHAFVIVGHVATILTLVAVLVAWRNESHRRLSALALTDMLTGLPNRRAFETDALRRLQQARREHMPVGVMLVDLDHFKRINDTYGHATGDQALRVFSHSVNSQLRGGDMVARWGGEEFCLLLHATPEAVVTLYNRLRDAVETQSRQELGWPLYFSAGFAAAAPQEVQDIQLDSLIQRADAALYQAKLAGRAQLAVAQTQLHPARPSSD